MSLRESMGRCVDEAEALTRSPHALTPSQEEGKREGE